MRVRQTYTYHEVTYTDYYNSAGKVVVTKAKKDGSTFEASVFDLHMIGEWVSGGLSLTPKDEAAKEQFASLYKKTSDELLSQIKRHISFGYEICETSFYK